MTDLLTDPAAWTAFLTRTAPSAAIDEGFGRTLESLVYGPADADTASVVSTARRWIEAHRA